ncbi:hypothetical protein [Botryobacter ruber]|uniref:hypothetical protein n=1 Tax=Botryobacter ruber TaxID=2171629 RepID=UPI000FEC6A29|nr:hypothetical protein [Botryobacter ruber]
MKLASKSRLQLTRLLVLLSFFGSFISYFTFTAGLGEIYPFFFWKLYTQPLGSAHSYSEYRIYYRNYGDSSWKRQSIAPTPTFTHDEYYYTFMHLIHSKLNAAPSDTLASQKLLTFIRYVGPAADQYKIVQEQYSPKKILENPAAYDTTTVIRF